MYEFPSRSSGGKKRSFQINQLDKYNGLTYSKYDNEKCVYFVFYFGIVIVIHQCSIWFTGKSQQKFFKKPIENRNKRFYSNN